MRWLRFEEYEYLAHGRWNARAAQPVRRLLVLLLAGAFLACADSKPDPVARPLAVGEYAGRNVVIVSVDTLRADHLGLYGYARDTSPELERLAREAITFEEARAPRGLTWPSLVSMFTSLYPKSSNVRQNGDLLSEDVPTIASLLHARGYETAAFLGNACGALTHDFETNFCGTDEDVHRHALAWIASHDESPFLLWVHYMAPHKDYRPPKRFDRFTAPDYRGPANGSRHYLDPVTLSGRAPAPEDRDHVVALYDGEVLYADAMMGQIVQALDARGALDSSIFVFAGDHGEELLQHNNYFYHSCSVYDAVLHIPLVIRLPDRNQGGKRVPQLVENIDLAPTLLELLGVEPPDGFEGKSLRALISGDPAAPQRFSRAISEYNRPGTGWIGTVRTDRWHYIHNPDHITPICRPEGDYFHVAEHELYDHERDPDETLNVAIEHPDVVSRLTTELMEAFARQREHGAPERADPKVIEQLKAMGYLVE